MRTQGNHHQPILYVDLLNAYQNKQENRNHLGVNDRRLVRVSATVGNGQDQFEAISHRVLTGNLTNAIPWAQLASNLTPGTRLKPGTTVATVTRFYRSPLWSFNPCRVVHCDYNLPHAPASDGIPMVSDHPLDASVKHFSRLVYHTLDGHLLSGEESLYVRLHDNDEVTFLMQSLAGPGMPMMKPLMWLIRPLQRKFLQDHVNVLLQDYRR